MHIIWIGMNSKDILYIIMLSNVHYVTAGIRSYYKRVNNTIIIIVYSFYLLQLRADWYEKSIPINRNI